MAAEQHSAVTVSVGHGVSFLLWSDSGNAITRGGVCGCEREQPGKSGSVPRGKRNRARGLPGAGRLGLGWFWDVVN